MLFAEFVRGLQFSRRRALTSHKHGEAEHRRAHSNSHAWRHFYCERPQNFYVLARRDNNDGGLRLIAAQLSVATDIDDLIDCLFHFSEVDYNTPHRSIIQRSQLKKLSVAAIVATKKLWTCIHLQQKLVSEPQRFIRIHMIYHVDPTERSLTDLRLRCVARTSYHFKPYLLVSLVYFRR